MRGFSPWGSLGCCWCAIGPGGGCSRGCGVVVGERDGGRRIDARAVRHGLTRCVATTVGFWLAFSGLGLVFNPVLRQWTGAVRVPGGVGLLAGTSVVGVLVGWAAMRSSGRYVAEGAGTLHGSRALAVTAANLAAARRDQRERERAAVHAAVRAWSPDLLRRGAGVEGPVEVIADGLEAVDSDG